MEFGFAAICKPPDVEFRLRHPDATGLPKRNLSLHRAGDNACVLAGCVHYRDGAIAAIAARVSATTLAEAESNDAALALALYEALGTQGLARLEGDFAVLIWDAKRCRFIARRDPLGAYPLFWTYVGGTTAFATGIKPLLDLLPSRSISFDHLADFLMLPSLGSEPAAESCAYEGVRRVLPAATLSVDTRTGETTREHFWNWASCALDPGTDRLDDIAGRYRELLSAAVRQRLGAPTSVQVSGGMDSTAVMMLALEHVKSGCAPGPLHTVSLVYERLPVLNLERSYIECALASDPKHLVSHRVIADDMLQYDGLPHVPSHDEPLNGLWGAPSGMAMVERAAAAGATAMITGQGGDDLLDMWPFHLADLIRRGRLTAAWSEASTWARARGSTPWRIIQLCAAPDLINAFRHSGFARRFLPQRQRTLKDLGEWGVPAWINADFVRRLALAERAAEADAQMRQTKVSARMMLMLQGIQRRVGDPTRWMQAAPRGIALSHPFLDPRVIGFALGLQERFRPDPSQVKPVLAAAMRGSLPELIRTRRDKRSFNEVYYLGISRNANAIKRMLESAPVDDLGVFDKEVLICSVEEAALGTRDPRTLSRLDAALSAIAWLTQERQRRDPVEWRYVVRVPSHAAGT
jgi:asparagine synthase (glutamine-hydrolysing)